MGKNRKGITLIALVVTIIVLLILAGVTITMLTGENGVLDKAETAQRKTAESEAREKVELMLGEWVTEYTLNGTPILDEYLKTSTYLEKREVYDVIDVIGPDDNKYVATVKVGNENYEVIINAEDTSKPFVEIVRVAGAKDPEPPVVPPTPPEDPPSSEEPVKLLEMINHTRISASDIINNTVVQELSGRKNVESLLMSEKVLFDDFKENPFIKLKYMQDHCALFTNCYASSMNSDSYDYWNVWLRSTEYREKYWLSKDTVDVEYTVGKYKCDGGENYSMEYTYISSKVIIPWKMDVQNVKHNSIYRCKTFCLEGRNGSEDGWHRITPNLILKDNDDIQSYDVECVEPYAEFKFSIIDKYTTLKYASGVKNIWIYGRYPVDEELSRGVEFGEYEVEQELQEWLLSAGISELTPSHILRGELLDELLNNKAALEYMFSHDDIYNAILNSSVAMEKLGMSEIGRYLAVAVDENRTGLFTSPYIEEFAKNCITIPKLDSNEKVIFSSEYDTTNKAWKAFDKNKTTYWWSINTTNTQYIGYNFNKSVIPFRVKLVNLKYASVYRCKTFQMMGSNNSGTYDEASLTSKLILQENDDVQTFNMDNGNEYKYVTCYIYDKYIVNSRYTTGICEMEVYCVEKPEGM